jgi:hypothetical protein
VDPAGILLIAISADVTSLFARIKNSPDLILKTFPHIISQIPIRHEQKYFYKLATNLHEQYLTFAFGLIENLYLGEAT